MKTIRFCMSLIIMQVNLMHLSLQWDTMNKEIIVHPHQHQISTTDKRKKLSLTGTISLIKNSKIFFSLTKASTLRLRG